MPDTPHLVTDAPRPAALLLTGGSSRRMGAPKAALVVDGQSLAERTASLLRLAADPVIEVGPGFTTLPQIREEPPGSGPLAAVAAGAAALRAVCHRGPVLVVATDLPRLTADLLVQLAGQRAPTAEHCIVPRDRTGRPQPLCARYSEAALVRAGELVAGGRDSLRALLEEVPVSWLELDQEQEVALFDVDTPADLRALAGAEVEARGAATPGQLGPRNPIVGRTRHPTSPRPVLALRGTRHLDKPETLATEEPMEIRVASPGRPPAPVAVTMRTPGHDFDLALGFLFTEGLIDGQGDVVDVGYCDLPPHGGQRFNAVTVHLRRPLRADPARAFSVNASCGVCGKTTIDQLAVACPAPPADGMRPVPGSVVLALPERLRAEQRLFALTGGTHGAGLLDPAGSTGTLVVREDVGRHNAVDKLIGRSLITGRLPLADQVLVVSGRVSFEIVQKAARAGIAVVVAVSAPTSLAVDAAQSLGVTLAGFVRDGRCNVYSHPQRVDLEA